MARGLITAGKDALDRAGDKAKGAWDFTKGMAQFALTPGLAGGAGPNWITKVDPNLSLTGGGGPENKPTNPFESWKERLSEEVWDKTEEMMVLVAPDQFHNPEYQGLRDAIRHFLLTEQIGLPAATAYEFFVSGGQKSDFLNNLEADRLRKRLQPFMADVDDRSRGYGLYAANMLSNEFKNPGSTELKNVIFPDAETDPTIWDWQDKVKEKAFDIGGNIQSNIVQPVKEFFGGNTETPQAPLDPIDENVFDPPKFDNEKLKHLLAPAPPVTQADPFTFEDTKARASTPFQFTPPAPPTPAVTTPVRRRRGGRPARRGFIPPTRDYGGGHHGR